jgi:hypothetical protein
VTIALARLQFLQSWLSLSSVSTIVLFIVYTEDQHITENIIKKMAGKPYYEIGYGFYGRYRPGGTYISEQHLLATGEYLEVSARQRAARLRSFRVLFACHAANARPTHAFHLFQSKHAMDGRPAGSGVTEVGIISVCGFSGCPNIEQLAEEARRLHVTGSATGCRLSLKACAKCKAVK